MPMAFTLDDSRHLGNDQEGSFALGFHGKLIQNKDNEFNFDGVLRIQQFKHSTATAFRISISRYVVLEIGVNKHSVGKDINSSIDSLSSLQFDINKDNSFKKPHDDGLINSVSNDEVPFDVKSDSKN